MSKRNPVTPAMEQELREQLSALKTFVDALPALFAPRQDEIDQQVAEAQVIAQTRAGAEKKKRSKK